MFGIGKHKGLVIGIDMGSQSCKVVQLQFDGSDHPKLINCSLIQSGLQDDSLVPNLKAYLSDHKIGRAMAACSIDDASMKIRKVQLPKMPHPDTIEAVKWKLRDIVDGDIDEFTITYSKITEIEGAEGLLVDLMAYAIKKSAIQQARELIERCGLQPFYIEPKAVSLAASLERCYPDDDNYIAGVDIGQTQSIFYVVGKGVFVFSRPLIDINYTSYKKNPDDFSKNLAIEIQKSIDTFTVNFGMETISRLYISGGGALIKGLPDYMTKNMGIPTGILNPFKTLAGTEEYERQFAPTLFTQAVALAYLQP